MYGIQTKMQLLEDVETFENDVNMYGIQTRFGERTERERFENDVNMYGIQTDPDNVKHERCLRMM